jgi:hypothetical protein
MAAAIAAATTEKCRISALSPTSGPRTCVIGQAEFPIVRKSFDLSVLSRTFAGLIAEAKQPPNSNLVRLRVRHSDAKS